MEELRIGQRSLCARLPACMEAVEPSEQMAVSAQRAGPCLEIEGLFDAGVSDGGLSLEPQEQIRRLGLQVAR